jgi:hypothetical protein
MQGAPQSPAVVATTAVATAATAAVATTAAAAAATVTAAAVAAATAATAAAFTGGCFVDADHATHPLDVLKIVDGFLFVSIVRHFDESEAALAASLTIERQAALADLAVLAEQVKQILLFSLEREVSNVNGHSLDGT